MSKQKIETQEEFEKRKAKEAKEIARLEKEKSKPKFWGYAFYFLFIISIVYLVDEVTTNTSKFMGTIVADYFFDTGNADGNLIKTLCEFGIMLFSGIAMVLRPLADRYGRKLFLVLYTLGMSAGLFIICVSFKLPGYVLGAVLIQFCIPHDVHAIYIQECAPANKRGTYFSVCKGIATLGLVLIPVFRDIFFVGATGHEESWRNIYFLISIIGIVVAILAAILMRESDVYIETRLAQLRTSEEDRKLMLQKQMEDNQKYGILEGFKHIFKHKQLLWIGITFGFVFMAYQLTSNYDVVLKLGWGEHNIPGFVPEMFVSGNALFDTANNTLANTEINKMLYLYPVGCALVEFFPGVIADKIGRKNATFIFGITALLTYVLFYIGSMNVWSPYILGFLIGAACGAIWSYGDLLLLMTSESVETNLRVSVNTAVYIFSGCFYVVAMGVFAVVCQNDAWIAPVTLAIAVVGLAIGTFFLVTKVKDTKDVDINTVKASDFE